MLYRQAQRRRFAPVIYATYGLFSLFAGVALSALGTLLGLPVMAPSAPAQSSLRMSSTPDRGEERRTGAMVCWRPMR